MSSAKRQHYDYADYLRSLEMSELKLEYCDGVIDVMAFGTPAHAQLSAAMIAVLHRVLPKSCRVATSDSRCASKRLAQLSRGEHLGRRRLRRHHARPSLSAYSSSASC